MSIGGDAAPLSAYGLDELRERRSAKWRHYPPDVLPLWVAEMDTPLAEPISRALGEAIARGDTGYPTPAGLPEAFAGFAARRYGWQADPASMRLVPDVMAGVVEVLHQVTRPGDRVVINTPAYPPYFYWLPRIGREVVQSPLALTADGFRLDLDALERDFAAGAGAFLLCNPHNPTGLVFSEEELLAVAALADRYGVRVVSDEIHAPLVFPGARHVPFAALDAESAARSVLLVSASKAWNLAGLKAALAVPGPAAGADVAAIDGEVSEGAGLLGVIASEAAFAGGEPWLEELMTGLTANRDLLGDLLAEHLPATGYQPPQATYLAWLDFRALGIGDDPAEWFLRRGGVALYSGLKFGPPGTGFARFNFATAPERVTEAIERMAASCDRDGGPALP
ncbi:pyridoxal phosphate-dependent aminotransferase [Sphaerisporangium sp. TRM90804]|uniref:MalY/PatB family protein n=1 Tax=Sphaerisporangium sp. TRM90804 TaxID=3031113 RepID=UPI00244BFF69|nr:pyridoxal phosphate-dependent aminotransferase [Sphaerisporangium sp. TRM90804]MDH2424064.1 pyridoxal phosphate-dependent aminotransferase [Sphaerisporangium sp. TRM90804]